MKYFTTGRRLRAGLPALVGSWLGACEAPATAERGIKSDGGGDPGYLAPTIRESSEIPGLYLRGFPHCGCGITALYCEDTHGGREPFCWC